MAMTAVSLAFVSLVSLPAMLRVSSTRFYDGSIE